jgi:NAD(P)-dependent dehydrogenase (short-subunit alcohol dehydrogenase family)
MPENARIIVLTGATRGLGQALAAELSRRGHTVLGCGRTPDPSGGPANLAAVDVADAVAVAGWASAVAADHGAPDLVVNNAALMNRPAPLWDVPAAEFGQLMDVNVDGTVNVIRSFVPLMIAAGTGVVVNLSSGWGRSASPEVAPYCASKWAIEGLTRSLAQELPAGLAAVALNPGIIDTDMLRTCWGAGADAYPTPEQWAPAAADLLLGLGPADNGASLTV